MATAQARLTPIADTTPAVVSIAAKEKSGVRWVSRFPTSIAACEEPFATSLQSFVDAIKPAGATVTISATYRPPERAYLMHWCWMITKKDKDPTKVPSHTGVNIQWDHLDADGKYDSAASLTAAKAMVSSYGMQNLEVAPALNSRHMMKLAVDMSMSWSGDLSINDKEGKAVVIKSEPRTGMNANLKSVGASYGVLKFVGGAADKPHWSDNGH